MLVFNGGMKPQVVFDRLNEVVPRFRAEKGELGDIAVSLVGRYHNGVGAEVLEPVSSL